MFKISVRAFESARFGMPNSNHKLFWLVSWAVLFCPAAQRVGIVIKHVPHRRETRVGIVLRAKWSDVQKTLVYALNTEEQNAVQGMLHEIILLSGGCSVQMGSVLDWFPSQTGRSDTATCSITFYVEWPND